MTDATGVMMHSKRMAKDREDIEKRLDTLLPVTDDLSGVLHETMRYAVLGGGKRIRALLCIGAHRACGDPSPAAALDAGCAIEMLHAYTLIHDDLPALDDDEMRRGKASAHVRFGEAMAILAGDALQAAAFETMCGCDCPAGDRMEAVQMLARTAGSRYLVGGQAADIESEGAEATEERIEFIHMRKTAALIAASLAIGALTAGNGSWALYHEVGLRVGYAFQIVDDLLDIEGSEERVGKVLRKDAKRGKITHPAVFGADRSKSTAQELVSGAAGEVAGLGDDGYLQHIFHLIIERVS